MLSVQRKIVVPFKLVTVVVGLLAFVIVAVPATTVQVPVPANAVLAAIVAVEPQMFWSDPASAATSLYSTNLPL